MVREQVTLLHGPPMLCCLQCTGTAVYLPCQGRVSRWWLGKPTGFCHTVHKTWELGAVEENKTIRSPSVLGVRPSCCGHIRKLAQVSRTRYELSRAPLLGNGQSPLFVLTITLISITWLFFKPLGKLQDTNHSLIFLFFLIISLAECPAPSGWSDKPKLCAVSSLHNGDPFYDLRFLGSASDVWNWKWSDLANPLSSHHLAKRSRAHLCFLEYETSWIPFRGLLFAIKYDIRMKLKYIYLTFAKILSQEHLLCRSVLSFGF